MVRFSSFECFLLRLIEAMLAGRCLALLLSPLIWPRLFDVETFFSGAAFLLLLLPFLSVCCAVYDTLSLFFSISLLRSGTL